MCTSPSSSTTAVTGMTTDGSRIEWLKWIQWIRWPGAYEALWLSVPERSQTYPDMETPDSRASAREALLPSPFWCRPLRHPSHPTSVGLACRPVGAWRRHLVKQNQCTAAAYGWAWLPARFWHRCGDGCAFEAGSQGSVRRG